MRKDYPSLSSLERELAKIENMIEEENENSSSILKKKFAGMAFVQFNTNSQFIKCLDDYKPLFKSKIFRFLRKYLCCKKAQHPPLRIGGNKLKFNRAPAPMDIIWENMTTSKCKRFLKL